MIDHSVVADGALSLKFEISDPMLSEGSNLRLREFTYVRALLANDLGEITGLFSEQAALGSGERNRSGQFVRYLREHGIILMNG